MVKTGILDTIRHSAVGGDMQHMLTYGIPEIGWNGDPWITLCWNKLESRWEIWSTRDEPYCVHRSRPMHQRELPNIFELCAHLRDHDLHKVKVEDVLDRVDKHNDKLIKEQQTKVKEAQVEALEKVYWHVAKEVGHHY